MWFTRFLSSEVLNAGTLEHSFSGGMHVTCISSQAHWQFATQHGIRVRVNHALVDAQADMRRVAVHDIVA